MTDVATATPDLDELARVSRELEGAAPGQIITWAAERFGDDLIVACSFEDAVLPHLAVSVKPDVEILFLDTQYHFAETLWFVEEVKRQFRLNLTVTEPKVQPDNRWQLDVADCCRVRKVEPLNQALAGKAAWITGLKRGDGPTRAGAPIVSWDAQRSMVKVNPLATWTAADLSTYAAMNDLPTNPLLQRGYPSIGCWPCTKQVAEGDDPRAGRWAGLEKTECGLHS
ncbi:MAG: phosphoadenylyl-sulfate reductase [Acidimicrobiales bacterium]